jgi:hypothetical protein
VQLAIETAENDDVGHLEFLLTRRANDIEPARPSTSGKGALDCTKGQIIVWSLAAPGSTVPALCPEPTTPPSQDTALVCARQADAMENSDPSQLTATMESMISNG